MNPSTHDLGGSTGVRGVGARGWELLLSLIRQRSIQRIHPVEDVLQSASPGHHTGRSGRHDGRLR